MRWATTLAAVVLSWWIGGEARGDRADRPTRLLQTPEEMIKQAAGSRVGRLIRQLRHASPKVRLVAILQLRREPEPRVVGALMTVLGRSKELPVIRGYAADALARMGAGQSIPALRAALKTTDSFVRARAKRALRRFCPTDWTGRRFYLDLTKVRSQRAGLSEVARFYLGRLLSRHKSIVLGWPGCLRPTRAELQKRNVWGYSLDTKLETSVAKGRVTLRLLLLVTSYPGQAIRGSLSAEAAVAGKAEPLTLASLAHAASWHVERDLHRFLFVRPCRTPQPQPGTASSAVAALISLREWQRASRPFAALRWQSRMRRSRTTRDLLRADRLLRIGEWSRSLAVLRGVIAREPRNLAARRRLGLLQVRLRDYSGALRTIAWIRSHGGEREARRLRRLLVTSARSVPWNRRRSP